MSHMHVSGRATTLQQVKGHLSDVTCCSFASNFTLITGSSDKTIRIWDWKAGSGYSERAGSPLCVHKYGITSVAVSPQGAMFSASSVDGTASLWSTSTLQRLSTFVQINGDAIRVCRFSPDSALLVTGGDNGAVCLWDLIHKTLIRNIIKHEGTVQSLCFSGDSNVLLSACSMGVIYLWSTTALTDTASEHQPAPLTSVDNAHDLGVLSCDTTKTMKTDKSNPLAKSYKVVTSGNDHDIKIWRVAVSVRPKKSLEDVHVTIDLKRELKGHRSSVTSVRFDPNGKLIASSSLDKTIKLWDTKGRCLNTLVSHSRYVNCVAFSREGSLISSGSNDRLAIVWDLTGRLDLNSVLTRPNASRHLPAIGSTVVENQVVRNAETDSNTAEVLEVFDDFSEGAINCCQFYRSNLLATASGDKLVKLFAVDKDNAVEELQHSPLEAHLYPVNYVDFSADGAKLVSCSLDGLTLVWKVDTGEVIGNMAENSMGVRVCRFSPNSDMIITAGDDEKASVWNAETSAVICTLTGHSDSVTGACFTPDNNFVATVCSGGDFIFWDLSGCCLHRRKDSHDLGVQFCDFSPSLEPVPNAANFDRYKYLLATCGNDGLVKLWIVSTPKAHPDQSTSRARAVDVKCWRELTGHGGNVTTVRFSPKTGEIVCSTASDKTARIWSVYSSVCLHVLEHDSFTTCCCFSEDVGLLAVGCLDKTLWLWKMPRNLVFRTMIAANVRRRRKTLAEWSTDDVALWASDMNMSDVAEIVSHTSLDGRKILLHSEQSICGMLKLNCEVANRFRIYLKWLKQDELSPRRERDFEEIPDEFLCPITHELMRYPVICSDGFTYEKQAISEWFLSGKFTSPMTNEPLANTDYKLNKDLQMRIYEFLYGDVK